MLDSVFLNEMGEPQATLAALYFVFALTCTSEWRYFLPFFILSFSSSLFFLLSFLFSSFALFPSFLLFLLISPQLVFSVFFLCSLSPRPLNSWQITHGNANLHRTSICGDNVLDSSCNPMSGCSRTAIHLISKLVPLRRFESWGLCFHFPFLIILLFFPSPPTPLPFSLPHATFVGATP